MIFREGDPRHGTHTFYKLGCRCDICRNAWNHYNMMQRLRRTNEGLPEGDKRHGTPNAYLNYGCRCEACSEAARDYVQKPLKRIERVLEGPKKRRKK